MQSVVKMSLYLSHNGVPSIDCSDLSHDTRETLIILTREVDPGK